MDVRYKEYSSDEMEEIVKHKNALLEKFQLTDGISRAELQQASDNYRSLTDEEAVDVLARVARTSMCNTMGAAYTDSFLHLLVMKVRSLMRKMYLQLDLHLIID